MGNDEKNEGYLDDYADHSISTYDDDEARRIAVSKHGLKI